MGFIRYITVTLINAFGVVIGVILVPLSSTTALAQSNFSAQTLPAFTNSLLGDNQVNNYPQSLGELSQWREQLRREINQVIQGDITNNPSDSESWKADIKREKYEQLTQQLRLVESRILLEQRTQEIWQKAANFANQALKIHQTPNPSSLTWEVSGQLWKQSIETLRTIPQGTFLSEKAVETIIDYQGRLAWSHYQYQLAKNNELQRGIDVQKKSTLLDQTTKVSPPPPSGFTFLADTNRDGLINEKDINGREQWTFEKGALMLVNNDDDNQDKKPDWQDQNVNGNEDESDLTEVQLRLSDEFIGSEIYLVADTVARPYINIFQKTNEGWQRVDLSGQTPLTFAKNITLGVESKKFADSNWSGVIALKAIAAKQGQEKASDTVQIGVSPWLMSANTAPVKEVYVSDRGEENQAFIQQLKQIVEPTGAQVKIIEGAPPWMQDKHKMGYVQIPQKSGLKKMNVIADQGHSNSTESGAKSFMNQEIGWFNHGRLRTLDILNKSLDDYGNLQVTPPLPNYPMGRVYYGNTGDHSFNPEVLAFIQSQQIQGPPVDLDTSWLLIRHVDEIINFIPGPSGKPLMMIVSPEMGIKLLEELAQKGEENAIINRGLSTQTTVKDALNNKTLMQHNQYIQRVKINPLIAKLKREFSLTNEQIIPVPVLFGYSGYAWWSNPVNSVVINGQLLVSNPRGALINGQDYTQQKIRQLLEPSGMTINFLEDQYYQELKGNTHSALATTRQGEERPFWQTLPPQIKK